MFDLCGVRWGSKNKHHDENTCLNEIELNHQFLVTTPYVIMNTIGRTYVFSLGNNKCLDPKITTRNQGRSNFLPSFCWCFIINLLMQDKLEDENMFNRRKRTRKLSWITTIYLSPLALKFVGSGTMWALSNNNVLKPKSI